MLRPNKKIEDIIQAAYKRHQSRDSFRPQKYGTTSRDPVSMRGQRGGSRSGNSRRMGIRSGGNDIRGTERFDRAAKSRRNRKWNTGSRIFRGKGRVGTGLAGSRRGTNSSAGGRGLTGGASMDDIKRRQRSNRHLFEEARKRAEARRRNPQKRKPLDPMRQRMKDRFAKASAAKRGRRWGSAGFQAPGGRVGRPVQRPSAARRRSLLSGSRRSGNRRGIMAGDGSKALRRRNTRPIPKNKPRVMGMPRQIEERYRRRR